MVMVTVLMNRESLRFMDCLLDFSFKQTLILLLRTSFIEKVRISQHLLSKNYVVFVDLLH